MRFPHVRIWSLSRILRIVFSCDAEEVRTWQDCQFSFRAGGDFSRWYLETRISFPHALEPRKLAAIGSNFPIAFWGNEAHQSTPIEVNLLLKLNSWCCPLDGVMTSLSFLFPDATVSFKYWLNHKRLISRPILTVISIKASMHGSGSPNFSAFLAHFNWTTWLIRRSWVLISTGTIPHDYHGQL